MQFNYSEGIPVKPQILAASLVLSSQIAGYSGGEVDSNATVGITFPIKVCIHMYYNAIVNDTIYYNYKLTYSCLLTIIMQEEIRIMSVSPGSEKQFRCAFFNFTGGANRTGGWSYSGVQTEVINETHVRCNAAHLTSFVVLVSIVPSDNMDVLGKPPVSPCAFVKLEFCLNTVCLNNSGLISKLIIMK